MNELEQIEQKYGLTLPDAYRSMQAAGWMDVKGDDYFWLHEAEWMSPTEILNHEPAEYHRPEFVPFAFTGGGDYWCWWPSAHPGTIVFCPHDCYDGQYYAASFIGFVYRSLLDYAGSVRLEEEQEVRQYLRDWCLRLSNYLPRAWKDTLATLASAELTRWSYNGRDAGWGLMTYEQKQAIIQSDLAFPLLDQEFEWMYPDSLEDTEYLEIQRQVIADADHTLTFNELMAGIEAEKAQSKFAETNWYTVTMTERMISPELKDDDRDEYSLRPKRLREFIGQPKIKENLSIFMTAAQRRGEALDHVLLHGPPGLGKTSLSLIIANEMGAALRATSGPAIERPGDLVAILTNLEAGSVLFLDEIHRLSRPVEEILYSAMEDYQVDIVIGQGPSARTVKLEVQPFTLVGATTRSGMLSSPLRDRFGIQHTFEFYTPEDLVEIITRSAAILEVDMDLDGAQELARRSRGTPRIANRLLKRVRDFAQVKADGHISREVASAALSMLEVDAQGLDEFDRRLLRILIEKFGGGPVGVETMAAAMSEERDTLEDVYEPYLMQMGFLNRTSRGRVATPRAWEHLGLTPPPALGQGTLL